MVKLLKEFQVMKLKMGVFMGVYPKFIYLNIIEKQLVKIKKLRIPPSIQDTRRIYRYKARILRDLAYPNFLVNAENSVSCLQTAIFLYRLFSNLPGFPV